MPTQHEKSYLHDGAVYGVEPLNLKEQLFADKVSELILLNENTGKKKDVELPT